MTRKTRTRRDSIENRVGHAQPEPAQPIAVPDGTHLTDASEEILWQQVVSVRRPEDWSQVDLLLLHKFVKLECEIRRNQDLLDETGPLVKSKKGNPMLNPLLTIVDSLSRRQLALIRTLGLAATASDARVIAADRPSPTQKSGNVQRLLAQAPKYDA